MQELQVPIRGTTDRKFRMKNRIMLRPQGGGAPPGGLSLGMQLASLKYEKKFLATKICRQVDDNALGEAS